MLVSFQPPIALPEALDVNADDRGELRKAVHGLTDTIRRCLTEVVGATDDWRLHHLMHRARKLIRADLAWKAGSGSRKPDLAGTPTRLCTYLAGVPSQEGHRPRAGWLGSGDVSNATIVTCACWVCRTTS